MKGYFPTLAKYALGQDTKIKKQCKFKYYRNTDCQYKWVCLIQRTLDSSIQVALRMNLIRASGPMLITRTFSHTLHTHTEAYIHNSLNSVGCAL